MTFLRPPREAYARGVCVWRDLEICAGVELRDGDHFPSLRDNIRRACGLALSQAEKEEEQLIARELEGILKERWPDRAYFIEVGNDREGWIQIYAPWGIPRNDISRHEGMRW